MLQTKTTPNEKKNNPVQSPEAGREPENNVLAPPQGSMALNPREGPINPHTLLRLQQTVGNRAVGQMLQAQPVNPHVIQRKSIDVEDYEARVLSLEEAKEAYKSKKRSTKFPPPEQTGFPGPAVCPSRSSKGSIPIDLDRVKTVMVTAKNYGEAWLEIESPEFTEFKPALIPGAFIDPLPSETEASKSSAATAIGGVNEPATLEAELGKIAPETPGEPRIKSSAGEAAAVDLGFLGTPGQLAGVVGGAAGEIIESVNPAYWPIYDNAFKGAIAEANAISFRPVMDKFNEIVSYPPATIDFVFGFLSGIPQGIISPITDIIDLFHGAAELIIKLENWFETKAASFFSEAIAGLEALKDAWDKALPALEELRQKALKEPLTLLGALANAVAGAGSAAVSAARQMGAQILSDMLSRVAAMSYKAFGEEFGRLFGSVLPDIILSSTGIGIASALAKRVTSFVSTMAKTVVMSLKAVREFLKILGSTWEVVSSFFRRFLRGFAEIGKKIWGFLEGPLEDFRALLGRAIKGADEPGRAAHKVFPESEARKLKQLAKDPKSIRPVTDKGFLSDGYVYEVSSEGHAYRRHKDGYWCRFSDKDCGYKLDPEDDAAFMKAAKREYAIAAGWAIEDYVLSKGYTRPRPFNFKGIDGWRRGEYLPVEKGIEVIRKADVVQVKAMNDLSHFNVISRYNEGIEGLLSSRWEAKGIRVEKPKSRELHMLFDQGTYSKLGLGQQEELQKLMARLSSIQQKPAVKVKWFYFSEQGVPILIME